MIGRRGPALALLAVAVGLVYGPEHLADAGVGTRGALDYVATGALLALAWGMVAWRCGGRVRLVALWAMAEAALRSGCRLALPLDRPPPGGGSMCRQATGSDLSAWLGILAVTLVVLIIWRGGRP